jgi:hypothetical protein
MKAFYANSKTAVVLLPAHKFLGSGPEVDRIADEIGQYGNIVSYCTNRTGNTYSIIFKLAKNFFDFDKKI